jgi:hypothetical protein
MKVNSRTFTVQKPHALAKNIDVRNVLELFASVINIDEILLLITMVLKPISSATIATSLWISFLKLFRMNTATKLHLNTAVFMQQLLNLEMNTAHQLRVSNTLPPKFISFTNSKEERLAHDPVNKPKHYTSHPSGVECIQVTEHMNFCLGNAIKYLWRVDGKEAPVQDLEKAIWYIQREIDRRAKTTQ